MTNIFNRKFPCDPTLKGSIKRATLFGIFVLVFLRVFKPFDMDSLPSDRLLFVCAMYSLSTFGSIFLSGIILPLLFPSWFAEETWTTGRQIILVSFVVILIGLTNYSISPLIIHSNFSIRSLLWFQFVTISISLLPITIFTLLKQNSLLKKFELQAAELEKKLQEKLDPDKKQESPPLIEKKNEFPVVELIGDYQGEKIVVQPQDLYMIAAANNYIKVYFLKNNIVSYSIIRMTMKKAEETLYAWPDFFRCHRAYIINLDKVEHVEGNAQGYKARLKGIEDAVPVSRNLNGEFSDKLLAVRGSAL